MGHAKELITMDVYADNRGIIADGVPEFLPDAGWKRTKVRFTIYTNFVICGKIKKFFQCCFVRMELLRYAE